MNVGIRLVFITQLPPDFPVPVGEQTISPAIPDAKDKPGDCGEQKTEQIPFPQTPEQPARAIKKDEQGMKADEEVI